MSFIFRHCGVRKVRLIPQDSLALILNFFSLPSVLTFYEFINHIIQDTNMTDQVRHQHMIHKGRVFNLIQETVTLPNGINASLEIIRHPGAAAIVPLTKSHSVIMLQQYRHAVGGVIWEIPAGTLNSGESSLTCARRELTEETGYQASVWQKLGEITPLPGYSDETIQIFLAADLTLRSQNLDQDEVLEVREIEFAAALNMICSGEIRDAKTICGLFMADTWLKTHKEGLSIHAEI